jgi:hypothetical protein
MTPLVPAILLPAGVRSMLVSTLVWAALAGTLAYLAWRYRSGSEDLRRRIVDRCASPLAGALFALLAVVAGTVSQFYPAKITAAVPLLYAERLPIPAALGFWVSVVLMFAVGLAYYGASGTQRAREVATLQQHTSELVDTLRTLPPEGFLRSYPSLCADMLAEYTRTVRAPSPEALRQAIRSALRTAASMAHYFNREGTTEDYGAAALRFLPADSLRPVSEWSVPERAFYPLGFAPEMLAGALIFDPALATRASSEGADPLAGDPLRIIIPEPARDHHNGRSPEGPLRVLPGSAVAYLLRRPYLVRDTLDLYPSPGEFTLPEAVIRAADAHYRRGPGSRMRSFVSIPLFAEPAAMQGPVIGTLDVECRRPGIFAGTDSVEQFAYMVAPVCFAVAFLLTLLHASDADSADDEGRRIPLPIVMSGRGETTSAPGP